jgi:HNH endonuclease
MTYISESLRQQVEERANHRCEYCRLHEQDSYFTHEIDHIYAEKHGGKTIADNLCLACGFCNRHKGSDICSLDPQTGNIISLFHPRRDHWDQHFQLDSQTGIIIPLTAQGRATERVLRFNQLDLTTDRVKIISLGGYI